MSYNERDFCTRLRRSADEWCRKTGQSLYWHKITDAGFQTPFDIVGCLPDGRCLAIEAKICKTKNVWNVSSSFRGRLHQIANLLKIDSLGGSAWVIVSHFNYPFAHTAYALKPIIAHQLAKNGSIRIDELVGHNMAVELPYSKQLYDLSPILG